MVNSTVNKDSPTWMRKNIGGPEGTKKPLCERMQVAVTAHFLQAVVCLDWGLSTTSYEHAAVEGTTN